MLRSFLINILNKLLFIFDYILDTLLSYFKLLCVTLFNLIKERVKLAFAKRETKLKAPSIDILKPEVSSLFSIFNRISGILLLFIIYFFLKISVYFDFHLYISFIFIYCVFFLFFFHMVYGRLKLTLFYDKLYFLVGNNFLIINIIFFSLVILVLFIVLFLVHLLFIMYLAFCWVIDVEYILYYLDSFYEINTVSITSIDAKVSHYPHSSFFLWGQYYRQLVCLTICLIYYYTKYLYIGSTLYMEAIFLKINMVSVLIIFKFLFFSLFYSIYYVFSCVRYYIINRIYITDFNNFFTLVVYDYYDPYYIDIDIILPLYYHFYLKWLDRFKTVQKTLRSLYNILNIVYWKK